MRLTMLNRRWLLLAVFSFCLVGLSVDNAQAQGGCNTTPVAVDMLTGMRTGSNPRINVGAIPNGPGGRQGVVAIDLRGCAQANIMVEYQGTPTGWSLHLADSPTCDGFGGDFGTTPFNAELQILEGNLTIYTADFMANAQVAIDQLYHQPVNLTDSTINLTVRNQVLSWSVGNGPVQTLNTTNSKLGFAIPDNQSADGSVVYLGLNRVATFMNVSPTRVGRGVRRVTISLQQ